MLRRVCLKVVKEKISKGDLLGSLITFFVIESIWTIAIMVRKEWELMVVCNLVLIPALSITLMLAHFHIKKVYLRQSK